MPCARPRSSRSEESGVDESYLRTLHENHEDWLHRGLVDDGLVGTKSGE